MRGAAFCKSCGQTALNPVAAAGRAFRQGCDPRIALPATADSNRSSSSTSSGLLGACGKERGGFPQAGGADPSEIPYPVVPEIWKRLCVTSCKLLVEIWCYRWVEFVLESWSDAMAFWLPAGEYNTGLWIPQGQLTHDEVIRPLSPGPRCRG